MCPGCPGVSEALALSCRGKSSSSMAQLWHIAVSMPSCGLISSSAPLDFAAFNPLVFSVSLVGFEITFTVEIIRKAKFSHSKLSLPAVLSDCKRFRPRAPGIWFSKPCQNQIAQLFQCKKGLLPRGSAVQSDVDDNSHN